MYCTIHSNRHHIGLWVWVNYTILTTNLCDWYLYSETLISVITCFTGQIQSEMLRKVQTRQTCDIESLTLILYSFIWGPRCFLLVWLSYLHIWYRQRPLLTFLNSFLSTYLLPVSAKSSETLSNSLPTLINNMEVCFKKEIIKEKVCYSESELSIMLLLFR